MSRIRLATAVACTTSLAFVHGAELRAQESRRSLDITVNGAGLSIGDSKGVTGLRINFRDTRLDKVKGINATIWSPMKSSHGDVSGLALGLPMTGARNIKGLSIGALGVGADERMTGIGVAALGLGAGSHMQGIFVSGIGLGGGGNVRGLAIGGIGVGNGGDLRGIAIGGVGVGNGGDIRGAAIGGIGVGSGGNARGLLVGGIGAGVGGNAQGIIIGGIGGGVGGNFSGLGIGGIGIGAGGSMRGILIGGLGVGSPKIDGLAIGGLGVGGVNLHGAMLSIINVKVTDNGSLRGLGVSAFNQVKGAQHGVTIGVLNYAWSLNGAQFGLINVVKNNKSHRVLPIANWGSN